MTNVIQLLPEREPDEKELILAENRRRLQAMMLRCLYDLRDRHGRDVAAKALTEVSAEVLGL